jgi:hypothetical protein
VSPAHLREIAEAGEPLEIAITWGGRRYPMPLRGRTGSTATPSPGQTPAGRIRPGSPFHRFSGKCRDATLGGHSAALYLGQIKNYDIGAYKDWQALRKGAGTAFDGS